MFPVKDPYQIPNALFRLWRYNLETQMRVLRSLSSPETTAPLARETAPSLAKQKSVRKRTRKPATPPSLPPLGGTRAKTDRDTNNLPV